MLIRKMNLKSSMKFTDEQMRELERIDILRETCIEMMRELGV